MIFKRQPWVIHPVYNDKNFFSLIIYLSGFFLLTTLSAEEIDEPIELAPMNIQAIPQNRKKSHQADDFSRSFNIDRVFSETLEEESIGDIKQAIKNLPNVRVVEQGAFIKQVSIRGFSGDRIQSVIDGIRISNQGTTHAGGGELNLLDIAGVDSIEVIKGSPAVIYAPGAAGGVINVNLKSISVKDSANIGYTYTYDDAYEKSKHTGSFSGSWNGLGARVIYSKTDAKDYKVKNQDKLTETILRTNIIDEREGTQHEIKNLGYNDQSWQAKAQYQLNEHHRIYYNYGDYKGNDIAFTHGASTSQVFFYDYFNRQSHMAGYELNDIGIVDKLTFSYSNQQISRGTFQGASIHETLLKSDSFQLRVLSHLGDSIDLTLGAEYTKDQADTRTRAGQHYYAAYLNIDYQWKDWFLSAGLRSNTWSAKQRIMGHRNVALASEFVGISGKIDDINDHALTYAAGIIYSVTPSHNIAFNYSHTYRFPSLYERFAFDNFVGGGAALKAEQGDNFELSWKFLDAPWFAKATIFYSEFENYLGTVSRRKLTNPKGLARCIDRGRCDPLTGHYDDRESDFFSSRVTFENLGKVINKGFEVSTGIIAEGGYDAGLSFGMNDIDAKNTFAQIDSNPLEFNAHIKKTFSFIPLKPWLKLKARYVTNWPKVTQEEGFRSFFTLDAYLGIRYAYQHTMNFAFNFGIRNITNEVYHEAFSALDGVKRSLFGNLSLKIKF